ncbi:hypothetical protein TrST_g5562 [Triparma strigata]|uniref:Uncharacterized protein n=1 Tax=Triparma strigata TaxID=1606541 RepID=A0A9W7B8W1_9STRA|nr:hypothetical protein TrST_g5562 [Triparma strigata]
MVKRPQTNIGYFVDGKLVSKPGSTERQNNINMVDSQDRNKYPGGIHQARYPQKKMTEKDRDSLRARGSVVPPFRPLGMEVELKNKVKVNDLPGVIDLIAALCSSQRFGVWWSIKKNYWQPRFSTEFQHITTQVLFKKNMEQRRPIYYACLCGHLQMVNFFMKVLVVAASRRLSGCAEFDAVTSEKDTKRHACRTFVEWMNFLGYWPGVFERLDYEVAWLSSLNQNTRDLLDFKPFSLDSAERHLLQCVDGLGVNYQVWRSLCKNAASETLNARIRKSRNNARARKAFQKPSVNSFGLSINDYGAGFAAWVDETGYDDEGEEDDHDDDVPTKQAEMGSVGRLIFQRAVSGELRESDNESFEIVAMSDDESDSEFEFVDRVPVGQKNGHGRSWADVIGNGGSGGGVKKLSNSPPLKPKRPVKPIDRVDKEQIDFYFDERDMYKSSRGGKGGGFFKNDRHRGKGLR